MLREISIISHGVKIFYNHINFSSLVYQSKKMLEGNKAYSYSAAVNDLLARGA